MKTETMKTIRSRIRRSLADPGSGVGEAEVDSLLGRSFADHLLSFPGGVDFVCDRTPPRDVDL
jgi:hypothetical protein